jgi:hypothetical protein
MRRDILTRRERAAHSKRAREWELERMTPAQVVARIKKTISESLDRSGTVSMRDLTGANIPVAAIEANFARLLYIVLRERGGNAD